jgi:hypothetical protein
LLVFPLPPQPATVAAAAPEAVPEFVAAKLVVAESVVSLRSWRQVQQQVCCFPNLAPLAKEEKMMDRAPPLGLELKQVCCCYSYWC